MARDTSSEARINVSKSVLTLLLSSGMKRPLNEPKIGRDHVVASCTTYTTASLVCTIRVVELELLRNEISSLVLETNFGWFRVYCGLVGWILVGGSRRD